jgi:FkbM family methyltransferase
MLHHMIKSFKKWLFVALGQDKYLQLLGLFFPSAYQLGLLRNDPVYDFHYYVRKLIKPGFTVIDIGANMGYYTRIFARLVGKTGKVIAIEPVAPFFRVMKKVADKYPQCTAYNYALGTEEKKISLNIPNQHGYLRTGLASIVTQAKPVANVFRFEAQMVKASSLLESLDRIDYIKCDIEGYETVVIPELRGLIEKHKPMLQIETSGPQRQEILRFMQSLGYQRFSLHNKKLVKDLPLEQHFGDFLFVFGTQPSNAD